MAMEAHPDRLGGDHTKFLEVRAAYDALSAKLRDDDNKDIFELIFKDIARRAKQR